MRGKLTSMYLKQLELHGFKTFADKTVIDFSSAHGITAIVGPNGCGKSNLIDAFRWVIGEQSMKTLRGSSQEEIIFAGTENRKPVSLAEVTLTIDNSDAELPVDYAEVQITRRYYRSNESEFFINKQPVRLKDIQDLFMDTGVSKGAYSIVNQGQVNEILHSKPEERRLFFEEAASVHKYKNRKIITLRKLGVTEQNLARLQDIRSEIHQQLGPLAEQARDAIEYKRLKEELSKKEVGLYKEKVTKMKTFTDELRRKINEYQDAVKNADLKAEDIVVKKQEFRTKIVELDEQINKLRGEVGALQRQRGSIQNEINVSKERHSHQQNRLTELDNEVIQLQKGKENLILKQQETDIELVAIQKSIAELQQKLEQKNSDTRGIFDGWQVITQEINVLKGELAKLMNSIENRKGNLLGIESNQRYTQETMQREDDTLTKLNTRKEELVVRQKELTERKSFVEVRVKELREKRDQLFRNRSEHEEEKKSIHDRYSQIKEKYDGKSSRLKLLEEMQQSHEGFQKGVRSVLQARKEGLSGFASIRGVIADILVTPQKYEAAIETALGGNLQSIVASDPQDVKTIIEYLKGKVLGKATFLPIPFFEKRPKLNISEGELASEVIKYDKEYEAIVDYLLGTTVVVADLDAALRLRSDYKKAGVDKIVTLAGEIVFIRGPISGGSAHKEASSLLGRQREILELRQEITEYKQQLQEIEQREKTLQGLLEQIEKDLNLHGKELNSLEVEQATIANDLARISIDCEKTEAELQGITQKRENYAQELTHISSEKEQVAQALAELNGQREELMRKMQEKEQQLSSAGQEKDRANEILTEIKISITNAEGTKRQIELKIEGLKESLQNNELQTAQKIKDKEQAQLLKLEAEQNVEKMQLQLPDLEAKLAENHNRIGDLEKERSRYFNDLEVYDRMEKESNTADREARTKLAEEEIKIAKIEAEYAEIERRLAEEYSLTIEQVLQSEATVENYEAVQEEVESYKRKIKRLEPVNLLAIEEYEAQKERLVFIEKQCEDLVKSKEDLAKLIQELDTVAIKAFKETFNEVNQHFKRIFMELFRGGEGELKIIDEDNVLESGVEIYAKVPGSRKVQSMTLLSGGQKALTAIALLFSLISAKPGPFCILDEIDAALDDNNIMRVTEILKKFSEHTQIIVITHRQPTMAISGTMFGLTQEEKGISKILSVKLAEKENKEDKEKVLLMEK